MDPQQRIRQVYAASAARLVAQMYAMTGDLRSIMWTWLDPPEP
ncbi:hypothetical protein GA0070624_3373 [Micromonospora rhizosphaerae]|uniref:Uncharacterized protein n=1 Tax=Micromonospora rhizosphaerae TaxID=568872 RepID=A0A1C6SBD2_9ACTN|nr:hypothetical protein [Micromonospora rhizosphaerae]SCL26790.1 hypothetical protein GA0070624_3373 [Micromonospora rhizosphaerae]